MRNDEMSFSDRVIEWVRQHRRVARLGVTISAVALLAIAVVLGWAMFTRVEPPVADPGSSREPSASAVPSPLASAAPTPASVPSASPSMSSGFQYADILRVEVNGLAVRTAPSLTSPLSQGYRAAGLTVEPTGDVRLNAGYFVSVHLGPLWNGDTAWYLVWPAEDARLHYNTGTWWDSNGDFGIVGGVDPGWVAASVGEDLYLTLYRRPEPSEIGEDFLMVSGTGNYESGPLPRHDLWGFNWAVAVSDWPLPCPFAVTMVPEEGAEPVVAVETSTIDVEQGPVTGPGSQIGMPWGPSAGGSWDSFSVSISSGCNWAVGLWLHGHD